MTDYKTQKENTLNNIKSNLKSKNIYKLDGVNNSPLKATDMISVKKSLPLSLMTDGFGLPYKLANSTSELNQICLSYQKKSCDKIWAKTLSNEQFEKLLQLEEGEINSKDLREQIINIILSVDVNNGQKALDSQNKVMLSWFLKEIECFAGIKFIEVEDFDNSCKHKIAVCSSSNLFQLEGKAGYASSILVDKGEIIDEHLLLVHQPFSDLKSSFADNLNTFYHECLHTLGLYHPKYESLEQAKSLRSVVADDQSAEEFIFKECTKNINVNKCKKSENHLKQCLAKIEECLESPINLQPLDVRGLNEIWGNSYDNSDYCKSIRSNFSEIHKDFIEPNGVNFNHHNEL